MADGKPLHMATIELLKRDTTLVKTVLTGLNGRFYFSDAEAGEYLIGISYMGFKPIIKSINVTGALELGSFVLEHQPKNLGIVTVTGARPMFEFRKNVLVFNINDDLRRSSINALALLRKAPGLNMKNEVLTLDGQTGILITINGKQSFASADEALNFLKTLSSEKIKAIEINAAPSAKYDKSVNGIINVVLFRDETQGLNGTVQTYYNTGKYANAGGSLNWNFRKNQWNLYGTLRADNENRYSKINNQTYFSSPAETAVFEDIDMLSKPLKQYLRLGFDYEINNKNFLSLVTSSKISESSDQNKYIQNFHNDINMYPDYTIRLNEDTKIRYNNFFANLNFNSLIDSASEQKLNLDINYLSDRPFTRSLFAHRYYDKNDNFIRSPYILQGELPNYVNLVGVIVDYSRKLKNDFDFTGGVKLINTRTDNNVRYDTLSGGAYVPFLQLSAHTQYSENLYAAYVDFSRFRQKWGYQFGLRYEAAKISGETIGSGMPVNKLFEGLYPSFMIRYNLDKKNRLIFRVLKSVARPNFDNLNPYIRYISPTMYAQGNLNLHQNNGYIASLRYSYKQKYNATLRYDYVNKYIPQSLFVKETSQNIIKSTYANAGRLSGFQLVMNLPFTITKSWSISNYFNAFYTKVTAVDTLYKGLDYTTANLYYQVRQNINLPRNYYVELAFGYATPNRANQKKAKSSCSLDFNISKAFFSDQVKLSFDVYDILFTDIERGANIYNFTISDYYIKNDTRRFGLTVSYDFGGREVKGWKERQTGIENEANRIKK